jgi:hypothetical protein
MNNSLNGREMKNSLLHPQNLIKPIQKVQKSCFAQLWARTARPLTGGLEILLQISVVSVG